jgi:uncharacterized protein (TIGR04255 family)
MALAFQDHPDVLFAKAPLESVLCQVRYSPVLALLDQAGVAGFQAALRSQYPELDQDAQATMTITPQGPAALQTSSPNWRMSTVDKKWRTSIGADFVALETSDAEGYSFQEFWNRFEEVLEVLDRTVRIGSAKRIGLRKVNVLSHPDVASVKDWRGLLRSEVLGLSAAPDVPNPTTEYAEIHFPDDEMGTLSVRHGVEPTDPAKYRLDLDYWTERVVRLGDPDRIKGLLSAYADSMTAFFHWCLEGRLYDYLEPRPRGTA